MTYDEQEKWENVKYRMREEGFHYCFKHYSSFNEIDDEKFHELRKSYLKISSEIEKYVDEKLSEDLEEFDD